MEEQKKSNQNSINNNLLLNEDFRTRGEFSYLAGKARKHHKRREIRVLLRKICSPLYFPANPFFPVEPFILFFHSVGATKRDEVVENIATQLNVETC